ncbi:MAG: DNA/RNA nuclease SfsA [Candidatus Caldarchaeum sp.]|uniref:DNA/RNA nuclease SfsA n=1 Tax=Caldiarchaeum subterraneum TaxID=311458 RepID=A0A7C5QDJ2_CALS0
MRDCNLLFKLDVQHARFVRRLNRFSGQAEQNGQTIILHITNTGRLVDLLTEGAEVLYVPRRSAKTSGVLTAVVVGGEAAVVDTRLQSKAFEAAFKNGLIEWLRGCRMAGKEVVVKNVRIDYVFVDEKGRRIFVELKSAVYLRQDGAAMYPDTVSTRGRRHIQTLTLLSRQSPSIIVFIAAHPRAKSFTPCDEGDPEIRKLLQKAVTAGVKVYAVKTYMDMSGNVFWCLSNLPVNLS